ncbi:MAG TPA: AAA family ATPase [Solirubrobacterales bacterium]|nr:AAA family ATPase [Solirubrobacterales bacterium]
MEERGTQERLGGPHPVPGDPFDGEVRIEHVRFASEDGAFVVAEASLGDGSPTSIVGPLAHLDEGARARVSGRWEEHAQHGLQLRAFEAEPLDPAGIEGARQYLKTIPAIGASRAATLIEAHGEDVFDVIDRDPEAAFGSLKGVGPVKAREAAEGWLERRDQRRLYTLLAPHGLARHVPELVAVHGTEASEAVRSDPYSLTSLHGVGFHSADRLALALEVDPSSPERIQAAAVHALSEAENRGHTHLPLPELLNAMRELLGSEAEPSIGQISAHPELTVEGTLVYRAWTHEAERWLAAALGGMARSKPAWSRDVPRSELGDLNDHQRDAVINALTERVSVITGGPGTGKTHLTHQLALLADAHEIKLRLLAPTGRAARRLTQATEGAPAETIHKALAWIPGDFPGRDESEPIEADLVIVDEASMLSLEICRYLIAAIGPETHLVLIGDADQLPPVGPGKPFLELIESGITPTVRLEFVFRQAQTSMIVGAAHSIRAGEQPRSVPHADEVQDFFVHRRSTAQALADDVVRIATERIPAEYGLDPLRQVQVLAPQYRGPLGIDSLHERIRDILCGSAQRVLDGRFRVGERVLITRSIPELEISNGTMFVIDSADEESSELYLETELGELLTLPYAEARALRGGFCASVHKAQGFEIPAVVVCLHSSHAPQLLSRNLLYTAVTRAQKLCLLACDPRAVQRALANTDATTRHSRMGELLRG